MITLGLLLAVLLLLGYLSVVRIPASYLGLPESLFSGRYKTEPDIYGNQIPIRLPYTEGIHLKRPWWKIILVKRDVITRTIEPKKYQTSDKDNAGATVIVSGMIQFRASFHGLFRVLEVDSGSIEEGLNSEIDNILAQEIGERDFDKVITMRASISKSLLDFFNEPWKKELPKSLTEAESVGSGLEEERDYLRRIEGRILSRSEVSYGVEVLKVSISPIQIPEEIERERNKRKEELLQKESQTTEWEHLMARIGELRNSLPGLEEKEIIRAIQLWQKQYPFESKEVKIDSPDFLSTAVAGIMGVINGGKK